MKNIGFVYDPIYLTHDTGPFHVESPRRLESIITHLSKSDVWSKCEQITPRCAERNWVEAIHESAYIDSLEERISSGETILDFGDTHVSLDSFQAALYAAGGACEAIDRLMTDGASLDFAFCAVRPPGHHAESNRAMGFCLFNNVAIAARYVQEKYGVDRVAIIDWDVHHGNGTQHSFYTDPRVMYISLHQYPFYPGTGSFSERGEGEGEGFTFNFPMNAGDGEEEYLRIFQEKIIPTLNVYQPDFMIISAGFDAHRDDPLAQIMLRDESYYTMTSILAEISARSPRGKLLSVLEGGYDIDALARCVELHLKCMSGE